MYIKQIIEDDAIQKMINGVNIVLFIPLGGLSIIPFSLFSNDKQILGIESVTRSINNIWIGSKIVFPVNIPINTENISAKLLDKA